MKSPYRGTAIAVGVLLIACSAASILSVVPLGSMLDAPVDLARLAANGNRVIFTALLEFVWAATAAGIAIGLYPVLRKYNRSLALGAVAARVVDGTFVLVGALGLLVLLSVGQESVAAGSAAAGSFQTAAGALLAVRDWAYGFIVSLGFGLGALLYYYVLYRSRLVPRWLSGWGLVGAGLTLVATVYAGFTQELGFSTVNDVLSIPIGVQEMVLAVWLIAKGFSTSAVTTDRALTSDLAVSVGASAT
jgi:hypothetical protein